MNEKIKSCWQDSIGALSVSLLATLATAQPSDAFSFVFSGETNGIGVTHQMGYTGVGGNFNISIGIDPSSSFASDMTTAVRNVVHTWNQLLPTTGNLSLGSNNNIPSGFVDFESVLLHEMGHSLGLAHINLASESGLSGSNRNYTYSTNGANNTFDLDPGADGVIGSADDLRGDDVNMNFFRKSDNDPFNPSLGTVDSTTYSRDLTDLPTGDSYSANADRAVGSSLSYANTEAVMQQGTFVDEAQRILGADDVAGILYAWTGFDEIAGTADDYTYTLNYAGLDNTADIVIDFDNAQTGFAVSQSGGQLFGTNTVTGNRHFGITNSQIFFNDGSNWFFNDQLAVPAPENFGALPGLALAGLFGFWQYRQRCSGQQLDLPPED